MKDNALKTIGVGIAVSIVAAGGLAVTGAGSAALRLLGKGKKDDDQS